MFLGLFIDWKYNRRLNREYMIRGCQNPYKLKITLATDSCSEGDLVERGVLTHPLYYYLHLR